MEDSKSEITKGEIKDVRKEYTADNLLEDSLAVNPVDQFEAWFAEACASGVVEPNAMALATVDSEGRPRVRVVLMKAFSAEGLTFYTNMESQKGRDLAAHPFAAVNFFWKDLERQVRIEGSVSLVSSAEADDYFASRPLRAQLGAVVSKQSAFLPGRGELELAVAELERNLGGSPVPRPSHWSGYRIHPVRYEFWQGRRDRLHDRFQYSRTADGSWDILRLYP